jgi:hypothetical protein
LGLSMGRLGRNWSKRRPKRPCRGLGLIC